MKVLNLFMKTIISYLVFISQVQLFFNRLMADYFRVRKRATTFTAWALKRCRLKMHVVEVPFATDTDPIFFRENIDDCLRHSSLLSVHGQAVLAGEIAR